MAQNGRNPNDDGIFGTKSLYDDISWISHLLIAFLGLRRLSMTFHGLSLFFLSGSHFFVAVYLVGPVFPTAVSDKFFFGAHWIESQIYLYLISISTIIKIRSWGAPLRAVWRTSEAGNSGDAMISLFFFWDSWLWRGMYVLSVMDWPQKNSVWHGLQASSWTRWR